MVIGLKQVRMPSDNLVPSPSTENNLLSLSELQSWTKYNETKRQILPESSISYVYGNG